MAGRGRCWSSEPPAVRQRQQHAPQALPEGEMGGQGRGTAAILHRSQDNEAIDGGGAISGPACVSKKRVS